VRHWIRFRWGHPCLRSLDIAVPLLSNRWGRLVVTVALFRVEVLQGLKRPTEAGGGKGRWYVKW
jgi:hypothetical protein